MNREMRRAMRSEENGPPPRPEDIPVEYIPLAEFWAAHQAAQKLALIDAENTLKEYIKGRIEKLVNAIKREG